MAFTIAEAERFKQRYLEAYAGVRQWQRETAEKEAREVRTLGGRLRRFDDPNRGYTERLNTPVQGTAADGAKRALALLPSRFAPLGSQLVLFVHDEFVVETPAKRAEEVLRVVEETMIDGMQHFVRGVPIEVEADPRTTWAAGSRVTREGAP